MPISPPFFILQFRISYCCKLACSIRRCTKKREFHLSFLNPCHLFFCFFFFLSFLRSLAYYCSDKMRISKIYIYSYLLFIFLFIHSSFLSSSSFQILIHFIVILYCCCLWYILYSLFHISFLRVFLQILEFHFISSLRPILLYLFFRVP